MEMLKTKWSIKGYFAALFFSLFFFMGMGGSLIWLAIRDHVDLSSGAMVGIIVGGAFVIFIGLYTFYTYWKSAPPVAANALSITVGKETYNWSEIESITLTGKWPFKYIGVYEMEGMRLRLKSGTEIYLFEGMYSNAPELKQYIEQAYFGRANYNAANVNPSINSGFSGENLHTYKGSFITSMRGIMLWSIVLLFSVLLLSMPPASHSSRAMVPGSALCLLMFVISGLQVNYFQLSDSKLLVRNHLFFWRKKYYSLASIKEVTFETASKQPNGMRIITRDFRSKVYPAATIRDKMWPELQQDLESKGIQVRNELL